MTTKHLSIRLDNRDLEAIEAIRVGMDRLLGADGSASTSDAVRYLLRRGAGAVARDQLAQQTREESS